MGQPGLVLTAHVGVVPPVEVDPVREAGRVVHLQGLTLTVLLVPDTLEHAQFTVLQGERGEK